MRRAVLAISLAAAALLAPAHVAADDYPYASVIAQPPWWNNAGVTHDIQPGLFAPCSLGVTTTDCVESIDVRVGDTATWQAMRWSPNAKFDATKPFEYWQPSGTSHQAWWVETNTPGMWTLPEGLANSDGSRDEWVYPVREDGGVFITIGDTVDTYSLPEGSQWRITLRSPGLVKHLGFIRANSHDPSVTILDASRLQLTASAAVSYRPYFRSCDELSADPTIKSASNTIRVEFSMMTNGSAGATGPASVVIGTNGWWCFTNFAFDRTTGQINIGIGTSHLDADGKVIEGWMEAKISGALARDWWGIDPSSAAGYAKVNVIYEDGTQVSAVTTAHYDAAKDWIDLRSYGFHYSKPRLQVTMAKPESARTSASPSPSPTPAASDTPTSTASATPTPTAKAVARVQVITCVKGKQTKKLTVRVAKCPFGWKLKK